MTNDHVLNEVQLEVKRHNPVLAKPISLHGRPKIELEKQISVDSRVMPFIFERHQADLAHLQVKHDVTISWKDGCNTITLMPVNNTSTDEDRFQDASKAVASFLGGFQRTSMNITPDSWESVVERFKNSSSPMEAKLEIQYLNQQHEIVLTGTKQDVETLAEDLRLLKTKFERDATIEASKITELVPNISRLPLKFLQDLEFDKELEVQYENTQVDISLAKGEVKVCGPPDEIHKVVATLWQAVANVKDVSLEISQNARNVLRTGMAQTFVKEKFTANNIQALLVFDDEEGYEISGKVVIVGMNFDSVNKASDLVKELLVEESLVLDEGQVQLEKSDKWRLLRDQLTEKYMLSITVDRSSNTLWLSGRKEDTSSALAKIERFFKENTIVSEVVDLPRGSRRFLVKYREKDLRQIQENLSNHSTVIKGITDEHDEDMIVTGTTDGVDKGIKMIQDLASTVESERVPVTKPFNRKALNKSKVKKMLALIENENKCVIEHFNADKDASKKNTLEELEESTKMKKQCECSFLTPEGKRILVFKDNICNRNVDVIVNAANARLKNATGVSKAIIEAGGEAIQEECDRILIEYGSILEGQVVVTSAGKLPFREIIHVVGPMWRKEATREKSMGKTPREEKFLRYAVTNVLQEASAFTSIALPAINTGACGFPRGLCAEVMVDAALEFCKENAASLLSEIQFTSTDDAVATAFVNELNTKFKNDPNFKGKGAAKVKHTRTAKIGSNAVTGPPLVSTSTDGPTVVTTPEGLKLVLVVGDMTREKVIFTLVYWEKK